ncbi:MAG: hypothetical protein A2Z34_03140 [Planctomycetes bacterium RBG_16_59_8]|nr:MAG: hypothetical protein A2Z34_03140 [Planctomycetes bacterium RBG_16_59_8]
MEKSPVALLGLKPAATDRRFSFAPSFLQQEAASAEGGSVKNGSPLRGDSIELTGGSIQSLKISLQYHLERNILDKAGNLLGRRTIDLNIRYEQFSFTSRQEPTPAPTEEGEPAEGGGEEKVETNPFLQKLLEYFNPEKTAQRIAGFVMGGFGKTSFGESDAPDSRRQFVDFITPFIRSGVDSALAAFGDALPDEIRQNAEETYTRVEELLGTFAGA